AAVDRLGVGRVELLEGGEARHVNGRLAVSGGVELLGRAVGTNAQEVVTQNLRGPLELLAGGRVFAAKLQGHADGLSPLAGEQECGISRHAGRPQIEVAVPTVARPRREFLPGVSAEPAPRPVRFIPRTLTARP